MPIAVFAFALLELH